LVERRDASKKFLEPVLKIKKKDKGKNRYKDDGSEVINFASLDSIKNAK
jgi:hypothetical protein